ncbi:MAG TPA: ABC transporter permease [Spirochaetota bacterium]
MLNEKISVIKRIRSSKIFWPLVALAAVFFFNLIFNSHFFFIEVRDGRLSGNIIDILNRSSALVLVAVGITFVIATGGIDISVGAIVAISAATVASLVGGKLVLHNGVQEYVTLVPMAVAILVALAVAMAAGMWNGMLVSRVGMQPIIATLILMVAGRGIAQLITNGQIITVYYKPFFYIGNGTLLGLPFPMFIAAFMVAITLFLKNKTSLGLFIQAVGINKTATRYSGINSKTIIFWVYVFSSFCAGIAGLIVCSNVKSADGNNAGYLVELDAILAVVLGGTSLAGGRFFIMGSVVGALIIQSLTTTIYSVGVPPEITQVVKAVIVFIVCLIQSESFRSAVSRIFARKKRQEEIA